MDAASPPRTGPAAHGRSEAQPTQLPSDPFAARRIGSPLGRCRPSRCPRRPSRPRPRLANTSHPRSSPSSVATSTSSSTRAPGVPSSSGRDEGPCFDHVAAARASRPADGVDAAGDTSPVLDRIREAESDGREVRIDILRHGLSPGEARLVEAAVADALGIEGSSKFGGQRRSAGEMDVALARRAKFKRAHQVVLLRVGPSGADASYEIARHSWRIGRRWIDPERTTLAPVGGPRGRRAGRRGVPDRPLGATGSTVTGRGRHSATRSSAFATRSSSAGTSDGRSRPIGVPGPRAR